MKSVIVSLCGILRLPSLKSDVFVRKGVTMFLLLTPLPGTPIKRSAEVEGEREESPKKPKLSELHHYVSVCIVLF